MATPAQTDGRGTVFSDRTAMVKAARLLLSSVTKVLVLADRIVIKQITASRNKVRKGRVCCCHGQQSEEGRALRVLLPWAKI